MPAPRGPLDGTIAGALASRLGVAADATADQFSAAYDKRLRDERLVGAIAQSLGLPLDTASGDVMAAVNGRLDARAEAVGLPAGAPVSQIVAAEAAAAPPVSTSPAPSAPRVPAGPSAEEIEDAGIAAFLMAPGAGSSNGRTPGEWSR